METKKEVRKQCSNCGDYKLLEEFFKEKKKNLGVQSRCKLCHVAGAKDWRVKKREDKVAEDVVA